VTEVAETNAAFRDDDLLSSTTQRSFTHWLRWLEQSLARKVGMELFDVYAHSSVQAEFEYR